MKLELSKKKTTKTHLTGDDTLMELLKYDSFQRSQRVSSSSWNRKTSKDSHSDFHSRNSKLSLAGAYAILRDQTLFSRISQGEVGNVYTEN